jgi:hypothetical protein
MKLLICGISLMFISLGVQSVQASDYYKVQVTRKSDNLYEVEGQGVYLVTRLCLELALSEDAIVKIDSPSGYNVGEIIFVGSGGDKCDIERVLK